jgi:uncharacterized membrane protein
MNLQNVLYILAIVYMVSYLLVLIGAIIALIVINRKMKQLKREMEIRKNAVQDWLKLAPMLSIFLPGIKLVKKLIS